MSIREKEIAENKVKPYLVNLGFPEELIRGYGKVAILCGPFKIKYADYVCYLRRGTEMVPYLVVEVKVPGENLDILQPEFYARMIKAPFFAVTDGDEWRWYLTGDAQGTSIRLAQPPKPYEITVSRPSYLKMNEISDYVKQLIENFENCLASDFEEWRKHCPELKNDEDVIKVVRDDIYGFGGPYADSLFSLTVWYDMCPDEIRKEIQESDIEKMSKDDLKRLFIILDMWFIIPRPAIENKIFKRHRERPRTI